jgi:hypothetical protein
LHGIDPPARARPRRREIEGAIAALQKSRPHFSRAGRLIRVLANTLPGHASDKAGEAITQAGSPDRIEYRVVSF